GEGANAGEFSPIIHTLFSNIKAWLVGTHHGVSAKHLPRYLWEWCYRFNRRNLPDRLDGYLIRRAVECATITYDQLKTGTLLGGANRVRRLPAAGAQPALVQRCSIGFTSREAPQSIALADPAGVGLRCYCVIPANEAIYGWDKDPPSPSWQVGISSHD